MSAGERSLDGLKDRGFSANSIVCSAALEGNRTAGFDTGAPRMGSRYNRPMNFPLTARFKLLALGQQVSVEDQAGSLVYYARQKAFKLKEAVTVFADEGQSRPAFSIAADRVLDISARYTITGPGGSQLGVLQREGMKSIWRTSYTIDAGPHGKFTIREENPWIKLADGLFGSIPFLGMFSGYVFHPKYEIASDNGAPVLHVEKKPALFEGRFEIHRVSTADTAALEVLVIGALMMLLLERQRG
jgi:uncharacterized protein YxjI